MDILLALYQRDLLEIIQDIVLHLSVSDIRQARLVCRHWRHMIETHVMPKEAHRTRELCHNIAHSKPCIIESEEDLAACMGSATSWDAVAKTDKDL